MSKDVFTDDKSGSKEGAGDAGAGKDTQNQNVSQGNDPSPLDAIVGEGKKYKDAGELVQGYNAGQEHILQIEAENKTLRESSEKAKGVQDVLDAVAAANTGQGDALEPDKVAQMIQEGIAANAAKTQEDANQAVVNEAFIKMFGDGAGTKVAERALELKMSVAAMKSMARHSPEAVLALFPQASSDAGKGSGELNPSKSTVNTDALNLQPNKGGTRQEYVDKRRTMNAEKAGSGDSWYFSAKTQNEMMGKAKGEEGQAFFG